MDSDGIERDHGIDLGPHLIGGGTSNIDDGNHGMDVKLRARSLHAVMTGFGGG